MLGTKSSQSAQIYQQENNSKEQKAHIFVCIPQTVILRFFVSANAYIRDLNRFFPTLGNMTFMCNGQIMNPNHQFGFYQISDGDKIFGIPENSKISSQINEWLELSKDQDLLELIENQKVTKREMSRLLDLRMFKNEAKKRIFKKRKPINSDSINEIKMNTIITTPPTEIPCTPLPSIF